MCASGSTHTHTSAGVHTYASTHTHTRVCLLPGNTVTRRGFTCVGCRVGDPTQCQGRPSPPRALWQQGRAVGTPSGQGVTFCFWKQQQVPEHRAHSSLVFRRSCIRGLTWRWTEDAAAPLLTPPTSAWLCTHRVASGSLCPPLPPGPGSAHTKWPQAPSAHCQGLALHTLGGLRLPAAPAYSPPPLTPTPAVKITWITPGKH